MIRKYYCLLKHNEVFVTPHNPKKGFPDTFIMILKSTKKRYIIDAVNKNTRWQMNGTSKKCGFRYDNIENVILKQMMTDVMDVRADVYWTIVSHLGENYKTFCENARLKMSSVIS